ncbi:MAG: phosphoenolpyruvate carboxykinase (ATP) [Chitinophagales bacterium]|nr:phosphoenolpyruvate carboxykinase (ATP) [Chitinophagales bacterium]
MPETAAANYKEGLSKYGFKNLKTVNWNWSQDELIDRTIEKDLGQLTDSNALTIDTGEFTGRAPKDKYIVKDAVTEETVYWGEVNQPFTEQNFEPLLQELLMYFQEKEVYVKDAYACADPKYRLNVRVISELPWAALFTGNLFLRPSQNELESIQPDWLIIHAPFYKTDPKRYGIRSGNFAILNFTRKIILIGGTAYTGEIKKGIFTVLNYILPQDRNVLSMHCSANIGKERDTAIFFGLSGTGKTTLSADPERGLIGDDEHGWSDEGIFNFEGGCYAKCVNLTEEKEPQIYHAIRRGALLENIRFYPGTNRVNYDDISVTENTRVSYPIEFIDNAVKPSVGGHPKNIFFLTCDAFGVLPPISKLTPGQVMYWFLSGYTAKVAGTEAGITEPKIAFSTCFGSPFLPLNPNKYAGMLAERMQKHNANVWLVNTGWTGGPYGIGSRMKLSFTRAMITEALKGDLEKLNYEVHSVFGLAYPTSCPNVPDQILNPRNTWADKNEYDEQTNSLANQFIKNFEKFAATAKPETLAAAPKIMSEATK